MNKYLKYGLLCFTGGVLATSCDVMDTKPMESYDEDLVWSSKETADAFVTEVYKSSVALYARRCMLIWNHIHRMESIAI